MTSVITEPPPNANPSVAHPLVLTPNPPMDTDGRREDRGRRVRKLQKRWSGLEFG